MLVDSRLLHVEIVACKYVNTFRSSTKFYMRPELTYQSVLFIATLSRCSYVTDTASVQRIKGKTAIRD